MKKSKVWQDGILKVTHMGNKVSAKQLTQNPRAQFPHLDYQENSVDGAAVGVFIS